MIKCCPDLTTIQWQKAYLRGNGDYQTVVLNQCIKERCAAYSAGVCKKYGTEIYAPDSIKDMAERGICEIMPQRTTNTRKE